MQDFGGGGDEDEVRLEAEKHSPGKELQRLLAIMAALRDPEHGCPWDREQTFATIAPYTIEEAYEVADAIERSDMHDLKDELGDLLLQVVYHARMAEEESLFAFPDVAKAISDKLIRRHPHVFGGKRDVSDGLPLQWEAIKKTEREEKSAKLGRASDTSLFQGIPAGLPALLRSAKLQRRAARIGFDWPSLEPLLEKVDEEWAELRAEIATPETPEIQKRRFEEFGDLMFVLINLGLHLGIDAEAALRAANMKFTRRMGAMEDEAKAKGSHLEEMTIEELEQLWQNAKAAERYKNDMPGG